MLELTHEQKCLLLSAIENYEAWQYAMYRTEGGDMDGLERAILIGKVRELRILLTDTYLPDIMTA